MLVKIRNKKSGNGRVIDPMTSFITIDMCVKKVSEKYKIQYSKDYWLVGGNKRYQEFYDTEAQAEEAIGYYVKRHNKLAEELYNRR